MRRLVAGVVLLAALRTFGYTNLAPAEVHGRLVAGDNVLFLDVREKTTEYAVGHIAEPSGFLPLTPANLPYNSGVLPAQHARLPKDIDIIVYCASGNRSGKSSDSLDKWGFTRVFNMTGGFGAWISAGYETRAGGPGDHSGTWIRKAQSAIISVGSAGTDDSSTIEIDARIIPQDIDSAYVELHAAWGKQPVPANLPASDVHGLYRLTALDPWGVPLFAGDSMTTVASMPLRLAPVYPTGVSSAQQAGDAQLLVRNGQGTWSAVAFALDFPVFERRGNTLYRWYCTSGDATGSVVRQSSFAEVPMTFGGTRRVVVSPQGRVISDQAITVNRTQHPYTH